MRIASGADRTWMRKPEMPNPLNSAAEPDAARALFASTSRSRSMIVGR